MVMGCFVSQHTFPSWTWEDWQRLCNMRRRAFIDGRWSEDRYRAFLIRQGYSPKQIAAEIIEAFAMRKVYLNALYGRFAQSGRL